MLDTKPSTLMAIRRSLFPCFDRAEVGLESQSARAVDCRTFEQQTRRHLGSQPPHFSQLGEHIEVRDARETVGPHGHPNAGLEELADWWNARTGPLVATRARDERRTPGRQSLEVVCLELHPVHDKEVLIEESHSIDVVDRTALRSEPRGICSAHGFEQLTPGPASGLEKLDFGPRLAQVHARSFRRRFSQGFGEFR